MKNYNEVAENVFRRRDEFNTVRKQKRREFTLRIGMTAACFCLAALIGFGAWQGGLLGQVPAVLSESTAKEENKKDISEVDVICFNNVTDDTSSARLKLDFELIDADEVVMTKDEYLAYFGTNIYPEVPEGFVEWGENDRYSIYKKNGGTGEVYYDTFILNYSNGDRYINIEGTKGKYPFSCYANWEFENFEPSIIKGETVYLALNKETGYGFAKFIYRDVGFTIIFEGITENEIVSVVSSLIV